MKRVYVEWIDAYTYDSWAQIEEAKKTCRPIMKCKTVGWLIDESKKHITICHTINPQLIMGSLHIPRKCIRKIKVYK